MATGASATPTAAPLEKADLSAWLAVAAGTLGALMATLDISIVNSALPTIQGEIGASGTEGTWIATSFLVAEIVIIPLSAWLVRLLGLRTYLLGSAILFTMSSIVCGFSTNLTMMILGRIGQGFTGGGMIPTAMTIIATRLPRHQQPIGSALFGVTAISGPVIGPLVGGWLTETISWHYAFFINIPVGVALVTLLLLGLPHQKPKLDLIAEADWFGILGMTLGLGGLTVVLEEGQREQWFSSPLIVQLTIMAAFGFLLLFIGQLFAKRPVIRLKLLLDRQFGSVALISLVLGMVLYSTAFIIPQFLTSIAGYNALQSGRVLIVSGIPSMLLMPITPLLIKKVDIRICVGIGMLVMAFSCYLELGLTVDSSGASFTDSQLLRGIGMVMTMMLLNQAAIGSVQPEYAGDAASLFNAARNVGGSIGLASIAMVQEQRVWLHSRRIEESVSANSVAVQDYIAGLTQQFGDSTTALRVLAQDIARDALIMTYVDMFWLLMVGALLVTPLVLFLKPIPKGAAPAAMH